jgi:hypothetical protein
MVCGVATLVMVQSERQPTLVISVEKFNTRNQVNGFWSAEKVKIVTQWWQWV